MRRWAYIDKDQWDGGVRQIIDALQVEESRPLLETHQTFNRALIQGWNRNQIGDVDGQHPRQITDSRDRTRVWVYVCQERA